LNTSESIHAWAKRGVRMKKHYKAVIFIVIIFISVSAIMLIKFITAPKVSIYIDSDGLLYIKANIDTKDMYIYWEADAGSIKPVAFNGELRYQPENAYFCITAADEPTVWDIKDYDGHNYSSATIRAYLYKPSEHGTKYYLEETIGSNEITVENIGGKFKWQKKEFSETL